MQAAMSKSTGSAGTVRVSPEINRFRRYSACLTRNT